VFGLGPATRVYLAVGATDLRKGFEGLFGLVKDRLGIEPLSGHVVCFCNRSRSRIKVLFWDGSGPIARCEYLALDVMAFAESDRRWLFPTAVIELENSPHQDQIAYSLWKVLCVRAGLRLVFCYRMQPEDGPKLVRHLRQEVIDAMGLDGRVNLDGQRFQGTRARYCW
jgi:IS66 Orf2 like protein